MDWDLIGAHDPLGRVEIDLRKPSPAGPTWHRLTALDGSKLSAPSEIELTVALEHDAALDATRAADADKAAKAEKREDEEWRRPPGDFAAAANSLRVVAVRARDLKAMDGGGIFGTGKAKTSDPFVKLTLGAAAAQTKTVPKTLAPEWRELFDLPLPAVALLVEDDDAETAVDAANALELLGLDVRVLDDDTLNGDDLIGECRVAVAPLLLDRIPHRLWYPLGDGAGSVELWCQLVHDPQAGPPSLSIDEPLAQLEAMLPPTSAVVHVRLKPEKVCSAGVAVVPPAVAPQHNCPRRRFAHPHTLPHTHPPPPPSPSTTTASGSSSSSSPKRSSCQRPACGSAQSRRRWRWT